MIGIILIVLTALVVALFGGSIIAPGWDKTQRRRD
jgi:hypothetical protein